MFNIDNFIQLDKTSGTGNATINVTGDGSFEYTIKKTFTVKTKKSPIKQRNGEIWVKGIEQYPIFINPTTKTFEYPAMWKAPDNESFPSIFRGNTYADWYTANVVYIDTVDILNNFTLGSYPGEQLLSVFKKTSSDIENYYYKKQTQPFNTNHPLKGTRYVMRDSLLIDNSPIIEVTLSKTRITTKQLNSLGGKTLVIKENQSGVFETVGFSSRAFVGFAVQGLESNSYTKFQVIDKNGEEKVIQRVAYQVYANDINFYINIIYCDVPNNKPQGDYNTPTTLLTVASDGKVFKKNILGSGLDYASNSIPVVNKIRPLIVTPEEDHIIAESYTYSIPFYFMSNSPIYHIGVENDISNMSMGPNAMYPGDVYDVQISKGEESTPVISFKDIPFYNDSILASSFKTLSTPIPAFTLIKVIITRQENFGSNGVTGTGISYKKGLNFTITFNSQKQLSTGANVNKRKKCSIKWASISEIKPIIPPYPDYSS